MTKKLSILVPIYNVAPYLRQCLDSLLAQGMEVGSYEVILIDDGSTDESGEIARAYAEREPLFIYHHKENGGLSSARNAALVLASGEYLLHVDSDDWLEEGALPGLLADAEARQLDLCLLDWADRYPDGTTRPNIDFSALGERIVTGRELIHRHRSYATSWSFIMHRSVVERGQLTFIPIQPGEDVAFFISAMPHCRRIGYYSGAVVYNYRRERPGAITQGPKASKELEAARRLLRWIDETYPYQGKGEDYAALLAPWYDDILADMAMNKIARAGEEKSFAEIMSHFRYRYPSERGARRIAFRLMDYARSSYRLSDLLWSIKRKIR